MEQGDSAKRGGALRRGLTMMSLILAGETVFLPAFHLGRYFKNSLLETFSIDEFQLGQMGACYGVFATACYFLGGPIADRWSPRKLLVFSLLATALGSLYMYTIPGFHGLCILFGFWGVSTILAFWAPLIRATQDLAGHEGQGRAFGILDAGRGLTSAVIASLAAYAFALMVGSQIEVSPTDEALAIKRLILSYAGYCCLAALCVWFFVPDPKRSSIEVANEPSPDVLPVSRRLVLVLKSPAIWLQAMVIISAYSAFKMLDNYGIYAEDVYGLSRADSANLVANVSYIRVGAAFAAGWIADRFFGVRVTIQLFFAVLFFAYACFLVLPPVLTHFEVTPSKQGLVWILSANMAVSCVGFFALRGIYFALLEDSGTPRPLTGTAVGVISFVGFTPEIYMGPLTGWLIREARAGGDVVLGYQQCYAFLAALSLCGMLSALALRWFSGKKAQS